MLMLSRKTGEAIVIPLPQGEVTIAIAIVSVRGDAVKISVDAPREVKILRDELVNS